MGAACTHRGRRHHADEAMLEDTGERLIPDAEREAWNVQIHLERYWHARRYRA